MGNLWKNRPVLVTGGAGFIGSWLSKELLDRGARVFILDIKSKGSLPRLTPFKEILEKADYISADVRDRDKVGDVVKKYGIRTVFHLAAQAIVGKAVEDPAEALDTNVRGTWSLLEACREVNDKIEVVVASSDKAYGSHANLPYKEDFPLLGENPYDCSKSCADRISQMYAKVYSLKISVTRCGNVYGGGDLNFSRLVPDVIRSLWQGRRPEIRSDGKFRRDYIFVGDIVDGYIKTAESLISGKGAGEAFNFGHNWPYEALEVVGRISSLMSKNLEPVILDAANYEIRDQFLDATKAMSVLGWKPATDLDLGLRQTIKWYEGFFKSREV